MILVIAIIINIDSICIINCSSSNHNNNNNNNNHMKVEKKNMKRIKQKSEMEEKDF